MTLRYYNNVSPVAVLQTPINDTDTVIDLGAGGAAGFPPVPFVVAIERGTANEEACLVTDKTSDTLTVTRGYDGTFANSHGFGSIVEHTTVAADYREAGVPRLTEAERDALADENYWEGRVIFNTDAKRVEVAYPGGGWDQILPTGAVIPFAGGDVPAGFVLANGQAISRTTYAKLFAVIGTAYGPGNGSTTFNVPDLRQRFPMGKAASGTGNTLGATGGAINHTHSQPSHTHSGPSHSHSTPSTNSAGSHVHSQGNTGSGGSHSHSVANTGGASVGSEVGSNSTSGLVSANDISHSHGSHSHSGGSTNPGATTTTDSGHNHGILGDTHSHSVSSTTPSSYSMGSRSHSHTHSTSSTPSGGSHTHSTPNTNSGGSHSHTLGNTGSSGTGQTGSSGNDTTGSANPPYLVLNFLVRV